MSNPTQPARAYPISGRLCPNCHGPVCTYDERADVHCQAGCGYQRSPGDTEGLEAERAAWVDANTCWDCE